MVMTGQQYDPHGEMWQALGQVVPHVESPDTLGTTIATALHKAIGLGQAAVILPSQALEAEPNGDLEGSTYLMRLVGQGTTQSHPLYIRSTNCLLARLGARRHPLHLCRPWPAELAGEDALLSLARERLSLTPIRGSSLQAEPFLRGAICLVDVPPDRMPSDNLLAGLASFAGVALNLLESKARAARQSVEYNIVSEIGRSLTSTLSLDEVFEQILSSVRTAIDATEVSVGLIDPTTQEIVLEKSLMGPELRSLPPIRLKHGQGVAGWVAQTGQALNVPDAYADPRFFKGVDDASGFVTRSILCVPLVVEDQVIGIMELVNKRTGHFTDADLRLMSALSSSAAIAIEKARLHADVLSEKRRMEAIFANMSEGLMTVSPDGRITAVNPALESMTSISSRVLVGQDCLRAIRTEPEIWENLLGHIRANDRDRSPFHEACDIIRPDGGRVPVLISGAVTHDVTDEASEVVVVFSHLGQIRELERMKDDFVANVTHELRTPLATILLYARLLRSGKATRDPKREARYLEIVEHQSNQLQKLVRQLLDLSRMEATLTYPGQEPIALAPLLGELMGPFRKIADQKGIRLTSQVATDLPAVLGSREPLVLVFRNLIDNAIKFTPQGEIRIRAYRDGAQVKVDITDEGIGIPPESLPYLFQRFYRTEAAVERGIGGTGLGLALVKEAVEKLGGQVLVRSKPDAGSTFTVVLPIADTEREAAST